MVAFRFLARLVITVSLLTPVSMIPSHDAGAVAPGGGVGSSQGYGCESVHAGPVVPPGERPSSYFELNAAQGTVNHEELLLANPNAFACEVTVLPAFGATARNSGDTFPSAIQPGASCEAESCWLSGLPVTVTVPSYGRIDVPFGITVPQGTPSGEYLAGVVAEPGFVPSSPSLAKGGAGRGVVGAVVVSRVAIGVAVTVPGPLHPLLVIPGVDLAPGTSVVPRLHVTESDRGNTWLHPAGDVVVSIGGRRRSFPMASNTVLPGDSAVLAVATPGVAAGVHPVEAELWYWHHTLLAVWRGAIDFPVPPRVINRHGVRTVVLPAPSGTPGWAEALGGALGGLLVGLLVFWFLAFWKRRRRKDEEDPEPAPITPEPASAPQAGIRSPVGEGRPR